MASSVAKRRDPNTLSNYDQFRTRHLTARLAIDFAQKRLEGSVELKLETLQKDCTEVVLDSSHVELRDVKVDGSTATWSLDTWKAPNGSALRVKLARPPSTGQQVVVSIDLATTASSTALQWLTPEQTSNRKHPYMFSQCQANHARSIFPCQDTPDVKAPIDFFIRSPLPVIASGLPRGTSDYVPGGNGERGSLLYTLEQPVPIPSYLFALASGDIATASIGPRSVVATAPEELRDAQWEMEQDMERYMQDAEAILKVPYLWTTYNVLVLPPSFPYGGMENPNFTFATPSIISGDRQNVDVIAHELSHSWSGNLVSNCSWEHFWLNEGWTTYLERRLQAALHGEAHRSFSAIIGWKALQDSIEQFGEDHPFTQMIVPLDGKDPDDAFSSVPYEKGFVFLYHLEQLLGQATFDRFIPHYFSTFAKRSLDSFEFKQTLLEFFAGDATATKQLAQTDWDSWFYNPGFPPKPDYDTSLVDACYQLRDKWASRSRHDSPATFTPSKDDIDGFVANQVVVFLESLESLPTSLSAADAQLLGDVYGLKKGRNIEVVSRYLRVALAAGDKDAIKPTVDLLGRTGRMKFVRPLFRRLAALDRQAAESAFAKYKDFYHPICRQMVHQQLYGERSAAKA